MVSFSDLLVGLKKLCKCCVRVMDEPEAPASVVHNHVNNSQNLNIEVHGDAMFFCTPTPQNTPIFTDVIRRGALPPIMENDQGTINYYEYDMKY